VTGIPTGQQGSVVTLNLAFYNSQSGVLDDPSAVQLDITYGNEVGLVADFAGPFVYTAGNGPTQIGVVYRTGVGQYSCRWQVPATAVTGIYVANWTCTYGPNNDQFLVVENINILGGYAPPVTGGDVGYWTGSLSYDVQGVTVPIGAVDANGTSWLLKKIEGWDSAPAVGQVIQRSGDHGGWPVPQWYGPRIITLTLLASAPTQALRDAARTQLQQVVPINDLATLVYNEPVPRQAYVRRNGSANVSETYPTLTDVEFTIPLVAPDPRKYGTVMQSATVTAASSGIGLIVPFTIPAVLPASPLAGSTTVTNRGNFEAPALVTITGPIPSPAAVNVTTGQTISYSQLTLGATDVLTLDLDARQGYLNGAFRPADPYSSWWRLQPGDNVIQLAGTSSGASAMTIQWRDSTV
jgi:hypothetical protein